MTSSREGRRLPGLEILGLVAIVGLAAVLRLHDLPTNEVKGPLSPMDGDKGSFTPTSPQRDG